VPKYLWQVSYSQQAAKGLLEEGGSSRRETVAGLLRDQGGSLEAFYFAFGDTDVYVIATLPDDPTAAALSLTIGAAGTGTVRTTRLLDPEDVDEATTKTIGYRAPGA
jgi:uncharacterized protein with GYD domain